MGLEKSEYNSIEDYCVFTKTIEARNLKKIIKHTYLLRACENRSIYHLICCGHAKTATYTHLFAAGFTSTAAFDILFFFAIKCCV